MTPPTGYQPNTADRAILDTLTEDGRNLPKNLGDGLGYSRQYIQNRLQTLEAAGHVENVGGGLYEITDRGRGEVHD